MREFKTIFPFFKENRRHYLFGIFMLILVDAAGLYSPQVIRRFADLAQTGQLTERLILELVAWISGLGLFMSLGRYFWRNAIFGAGRRLEYWLRDKLFRHYLHQDQRFFTDHTTGDLMAHATNDVVMVGQAMGGGVMMLVDSLFMTAFTVIMLVSTIGIGNALVALVSLPFLAFVIAKLMGPIHRRGRALQNAFSDLTSETEENLSGMRVIKACAIEDNRSASFRSVNRDYAKKFIRWSLVDMLFDPSVTLISGLSFVVFILYGALQIRREVLTIGAFVATIEYLNMIVWPLIAMGMIVSQFQRGASSMARLNELFRIRSTVEEVPNPVEDGEWKGEVEFRHVSFRYAPNLPWVLKDINFTLHPGNSLAILGKTGVGKSTVVQLLLRRYDVTEGQILVDGVDIRQCSFDRLYQTFGVVAQESFLFSRSIAENIAFGGEEENREAVIEAARFAQVDNDIQAMKEGYDTVVGERGVTLSGGQKQRISIARAYYRNAPILLLDDALSAVDTETESRILAGLKKHKKGIIMISQRISTVQHADEIVVLEEGAITQRGNHEKLANESGFYRDLYHRQLLESQMDGDSKKEIAFSSASRFAAGSPSVMQVLTTGRGSE